MLALLLARRGVPTALLEMDHDFDREFRGDTVHPSTLEILDQLGLAQRVHSLPSNKISGPTLLTTRGPFTPFDLGRLKTKYPYILMVHQAFPEHRQCDSTANPGTGAGDEGNFIAQAIRHRCDSLAGVDFSS